MSIPVRTAILCVAASLGTGVVAEDFGVAYIVGKTYPSLTPRKVLRVKVADSDVGTDSGWNAPQSPSSYQIDNVTKKKTVGVTQVDCAVTLVSHIGSATTKAYPTRDQTKVLAEPALHYVLRVSRSSSENKSATLAATNNNLDGLKDSINGIASKYLTAAIVEDKQKNGFRLQVTSHDPSGLPDLMLIDAGTGNDLLEDRVTIRTDTVPDCDIVYLHLDPNATSDGDELQVTLNGATKHVSSVTAVVKGAGAYTLSLSPGYIPNEDLTNGETRNVGQLETKFDVPFLIPSWSFARTYLTTDDLFSTDAKDTASKIHFLTGVERSLTSSWFIPLHLETELNGNQTADNLSSVTSTGFRTLIPWAAVKPILYNPLFQAPVSPELQFDAQYERRIRQDPQTALNSPKKDVFRVFGQTAWKPIRLLPGAAKSDTLDLELLGKGWYIPYDRDKFNKRKDRLEGSFEVSLLVPLTKLNFIPGSQLLAAADSPTQRIRIKYSIGANDANGFRHSKQLSLGVEMIK